MLLDIFIVFFCYLQIKLVIRMNTNFRIPFKVRILVPKERHWATELDMWEYILFTSILSEKNELSFSRVGSISIKIATSGDPPFTLSSLISSWYKGYLAWVIYSSVGKVYNNKTRNEAGDPLIGFDFDEIVDPIAVIHVRKAFIFHGAVGVDEGL